MVLTAVGKVRFQSSICYLFWPLIFWLYFDIYTGDHVIKHKGRVPVDDDMQAIGSMLQDIFPAGKLKTPDVSWELQVRKIGNKF